MTTDTSTPDQPDDTDTPTEESAAPVRVPNVSAGARSGLDHEVIGANAQEAYDVNQTLDGNNLDARDEDPRALGDPDGYYDKHLTDATDNERLAWVAAAPDAEATDDAPDVTRYRAQRADTVFGNFTGTDAEMDALTARLHHAVYGADSGAPDTPETADQLGSSIGTAEVTSTQSGSATTLEDGPDGVVPTAGDGQQPTT